MLDEYRKESGNETGTEEPGWDAGFATERLEPLFLDEPADYDRRARTTDSESALDLFADEEHPETWDESRAGATIIDVDPPLDEAMPLEPAPRVRPAFLAALSLAAAAGAFAAVRSYQLHGAWSSTVLQFLGR